MKKILLFILFNCFVVNAQETKGINGDTNWLKNWTNFKSKATEYLEPTSILSGIISQNTTLYKKEVYKLTGMVYVTNGAILTIEPGTQIRGDFETKGTLIITKGSKIIAEGQETDPIIFTSSKAGASIKTGDWGGIVILGEAPSNKFECNLSIDFGLNPNMASYGGKNNLSDSGSLKYVRIEYGGGKIGNSKINALTLAGVGSKTKLDFIQLVSNNNHGFKCYGGDISLSHAISYKSMGNDYDFTEGVQAKLKNCLAVRNPYVSNTGRSRCFEIKSYDVIASTDLTKATTNVTAENTTLLNEETDLTGLTREAIYIKEKAGLTLTNSIVSGFRQCIVFENKIKMIPENLKKIQVKNVLINNCKKSFESEEIVNNVDIKNWYNDDKFMIESSNFINTDFFVETDLIKKTPDYRINQQKVVTSRLVIN